MTVAEYAAELRDLRDKVTTAARAADVAVARYNLRLAEVQAALHVAPGQMLDVDTGEIVPTKRGGP